MPMPVSQEKLLALGPVLEQLNQDLLDPMIDIVFQIMLRQDLVPPPPPELQGTKVRIEYISIMAQAQKMVGISSVERFISFGAQVAAFSPEALDKINVDEAMDIYGEMTSVPPKLLRSDEEVAAMRESRRVAQQQQRQMEMIEQGANAAQKLGNTPMDQNSALGRLAGLSNAGALAPIG